MAETRTVRMGRPALKLLGTFEVTLSNGRNLRLLDGKSWALLARLAVHPGVTVGRESLAALLWGDRPESQARGSLRQALHEIRAALGDDADGVLTTTRASAMLRGHDVDVPEFERLAASGSEDDLIAAELLYRGPLLHGFESGEAAFDAWLSSERARLHESARRAFEVLAGVQLQQHQTEAAVATARRLVGFNPFDEAGHRLLMRALAACGRRNEALTHYGHVERLLREELSVAPMPETKALGMSLRELSSSLTAATVAPVGRLAVVVLPFEVLQGDPGQENFAFGLTEDLITALCRVPELLVVAHESVAAYRLNPAPLRQIADDLGVRHVVQGSVQKQGSAVRVTARLVEAVTGRHLWGERFDRTTKDFLALQDEIIRHVLVALEIKLTMGEVARNDGRGTTNLDAWLLRTEALSEKWKFSREGTRRTRELASAARDLDPNWVEPWGTLAWSYWWEARQGWANSKEEAIRIGVACATKALQLDPDHPYGYMQLGNFAQLVGDHERAIELREKAVKLAPNDLGALWGLGGVLLRAGQTERALAVFKRTAAVAPRPPASLWWRFTHATLVAGDVDAAVAMAKRTVASKPDSPDGLAFAAMAFVAAGRLAEARDTVAEIHQIAPTYSVAEWRATQGDFRDRAAVDRLAELLARAGLP